MQPASYFVQLVIQPVSQLLVFWSFASQALLTVIALYSNTTRAKSHI